MTHTGEEIALGPIGKFCLLLGNSQLSCALIDQLFEMVTMTFQLILPLLYSPAHPVEFGRKPADFAPGRYNLNLGVLTLAHLLDRIDQGIQRTGCQAYEQIEQQNTGKGKDNRQHSSAHDDLMLGLAHDLFGKTDPHPTDLFSYRWSRTAPLQQEEPFGGLDCDDRDDEFKNIRMF